MTDEEMARLFIIDKYGLRKDLEIWRIKQDEDLSIDLYAFLAGLEAGRPKWHKVVDGDLPKHEKDVQVLYQDCDKVNSYICLYDIHGECWLYYNLDNMLLEPFDYRVIAWCEIPKLEEADNA